MLVPDLAESIPQPTDGGKTYTFQIRRGIRFSNGQVMKPSDFVRTFERQFTVPGPTTFYAGIVGASACTNATKTLKCDLTRGVVANDSNYTLTIHLTKPDPEFLDKLAMPFAYAVPGNTSLKLLGNNVPPGTGPYMWKSYNPNTSAVLVRNPYFHVWDAEAQPPGNPNEIVQKYGLQITDEVTQVENGGADEVFDGNVIPADRLNELDSPRYAAQLHVHPLTNDYYFALNTTRPPFNNQKARQAINYAADRSAYVKIAGGPSLGVPTCQILPPNFPGYVPYCPYTAGSNRTKWTAPDILKAKQLVKESGTAGMKVVVNSGNDARPRHSPSRWSQISRGSAIRRRRSSVQHHPAIVRRQFGQPQQVECCSRGLGAGLPGGVGLPERAARLRVDPPWQRCQPEHRGLLQPHHPGQDGSRGGGRADEPDRRQQDLGAGRP